MKTDCFRFRNTGWLVRLVLTLFLLLMFLPNQTIAAPENAMDFLVLDAIVLEQMEKHGLPGVALAIIDGEDIVYSQGYGKADRIRPMTSQTKMFIGSLSKSFTALAIAQLVDQGKLDLDTPVQSYITWFRVADDDGSQKLQFDIC